MKLQLLIGTGAAVAAAYWWRNPTKQFWVGVNFTLAGLTLFDLILHLLGAKP